MSHFQIDSFTITNKIYWAHAENFFFRMLDTNEVNFRLFHKFNPTVWNHTFNHYLLPQIFFKELVNDIQWYRSKTISTYCISSSENVYINQFILCFILFANCSSRYFLNLSTMISTPMMTRHPR